MKKYIVCASLCLVCLGFGSCSEDKLEAESVIVDSNVKQTEFDKWIKVNLTDPYNIQFVYRYDHNETDMNYYNVPADYEQAVKLAHIVKYASIEAYDQVAGVDFTRTYFPKLFYATGEFQYRNNGTMILGTAEGGKKIFLAGTNHLNKLSTTVESLNTYYLRTIHHEFTHILNQTKNYTAEYQKVNGSLYIGDAWSSPEGQTGYLQRGFISAYSQMEAREDFAEMLSMYITNTPEQWAKWMAEAGAKDPETKLEAPGAGHIAKKLEMVRVYMRDEFNIDIDVLRDEILRREGDVINGYVNLTDLKIDK